MKRARDNDAPSLPARRGGAAARAAALNNPKLNARRRCASHGPPAARRREGCESGFTLLEMTAAMLIVAMIASLTILAIPGTGRAGLKAVTMNAASLFRRERAAALLTRSERHIRLDPARRLLVGEDGAAVAIPADVIVDILGAEGRGADGAPDLAFYPDGGSSGGAFRFSRETAEYEVRINWYTGGVSVAAPQS